MSEDFVTLDQAKKLKELGFQEKCFAYFLYDDEVEIGTRMQDYNYIVGLDYISAPTLAQAQKWLREIKRIHLFVTMENSNYYWYIGEVFSIGNFQTYEQALSAGIDKALEICNYGTPQ